MNDRPDHFKTSVTLVGERQIDEFQALCAWYGRRPHQLAADMVLAEIRRHRRRKQIAEFVHLLVSARQRYRAEQAGEAVDLEAYRRAHR